MPSSHLQYAQSEHRSSFGMAAQPAHAPESSASISVDGRSRPMESSAQSTRHNFDLLSGIQGLGSGSTSASLMDSEARFPQSFNLLKFYIDRDGPWHPFSKTSTDARSDDPRARNQPLVFGPGIPSSFHDYRESVPSECDTIGPDALLSDSGYGSMTKASVGIPSHYGEFDRNLETQSIIGHFSEIQLQGPEKAPWAHQSAGQSQAGSDRLTCPMCLKQVKNRSELNKHNLRHTKPYSCDVQGCQRDRGFSTKNDLARHKESVHKATGVKYVCELGQCKSKSKIWPRADNFRQHLKRIHDRHIAADDEELRSFIYLSPDMEASSAGYEQPMAPDVEESCLSSSNWELQPSLEDHMNTEDGSSPDSMGRGEEELTFSGPDGHPESSFFSLNEEGDDHDEEHSVELDTMAGDSLQFQHMLPHDPVSQLPTCSSTSLGGSPTSGFSCIPPDALSHPSLHREPQEDSDERCKILDLGSHETAAPNPSEQQDCFKEDLLTEDAPLKPSVESVQTGETNVTIELDAIIVDMPQKEEARTPGGPSSLPTEETDDSGLLAVLEETQNPEESPAPESKPPVNALVAGISTDDDEGVNNILKALHDKGLLEKALGDLGYQRKDPSSKPKKLVGSKAPVVANNQVRCEKCDKTFKRKCELKKHSKRHERPYGCTHPGCTKRFGSKNDWKRHENSQHFMLAVWKCEEKLAEDPNQVCGKACYRRETFKHHLQRSHNITDWKMAEEKLESCRLGQNYESRFWCGFCETKIEVKGTGRDAWTERFNHIDDHFSGRKAPKKDIKEWKNVDPAGPNPDEYPSSSDVGSRAGTPEPLTDDRHGSSATVVTPSPAGESRKRALDDAADSEPDAKRRKGVGIWWFCCECRTQNTVVTNSSCMESVCNHSRCGSCKLENHRVQEFEDDGERSSSQ